jgi:hypothetical protein
MEVEGSLIGTVASSVLHPIHTLTHPVETVGRIADCLAQSIIGAPVRTPKYTNSEKKFEAHGQHKKQHEKEKPKDMRAGTERLERHPKKETKAETFKSKSEVHPRQIGQPTVEKQLSLEERKEITHIVLQRHRQDSETAMKEAEMHAELLVDAEAMMKDSVLKLAAAEEAEVAKRNHVQAALEREFELERARADQHELALRLENERAQLEAEVQLHKKKTEYAEALMRKHAERIQYHKALGERRQLEYQEALLSLQRLEFEMRHKKELRVLPDVPEEKKLEVEVKARALPEIKFETKEVPITASASSVVKEHYKHPKVLPEVLSTKTETQIVREKTVTFEE